MIEFKRSCYLFHIDTWFFCCCCILSFLAAFELCGYSPTLILFQSYTSGLLVVLAAALRILMSLLWVLITPYWIDLAPREGMLTTAPLPCCLCWSRTHSFWKCHPPLPPDAIISTLLSSEEDFVLPHSKFPRAPFLGWSEPLQIILSLSWRTSPRFLHTSARMDFLGFYLPGNALFRLNSPRVFGFSLFMGLFQHLKDSLLLPSGSHRFQWAVIRIPYRVPVCEAPVSLYLLPGWSLYSVLVCRCVPDV